VLPSEPFAVDEVRSGEISSHAGAVESFDRLAVEWLGLQRIVGYERGRTRFESEAPIRRDYASPLDDVLHRAAGSVSLAAARGRFDQVWEGPEEDPAPIGVTCLAQHREVAVSARIAVAGVRRRPARRKRARAADLLLAHLDQSDPWVLRLAVAVATAPPVVGRDGRQAPCLADRDRDDSGRRPRTAPRAPGAGSVGEAAGGVHLPRRQRRDPGFRRAFAAPRRTAGRRRTRSA